MTELAADRNNSIAKSESPQERVGRSRAQLSLRFLLLMNVIFCVIAGAVYWASRVPAISNEVSMMLGGRAESNEASGRRVQIVFVMFTYTAPLILAGTLATILSVIRFFERRMQKQVARDELPSHGAG
jgi:hypothetical protein